MEIPGTGLEEAIYDAAKWRLFTAYVRVTAETKLPGINKSRINKLSKILEELDAVDSIEDWDTYRLIYLLFNLDNRASLARVIAQELEEYDLEQARQRCEGDDSGEV